MQNVLDSTSLTASLTVSIIVLPLSVENFAFNTDFLLICCCLEGLDAETNLACCVNLKVYQLGKCLK